MKSYVWDRITSEPSPDQFWDPVINHRRFWCSGVYDLLVLNMDGYLARMAHVPTYLFVSSIYFLMLLKSTYATFALSIEQS